MANETLQWFPFYPDDFLGGTARMNDAEVGCYIRLLCYQWEEGAIPQDAMDAFLTSRDPEERKRILAKFESSAEGESGGEVVYYRNKRLSHELSASTQRKQAGGGETKGKTKKKATPWPKAFTLTDKLKHYAESKGVANPDEAWEQFEAYHKAKGNSFSDWEQAWRTWCLSPYQKRAGIL